jgi:hypothetical protein
MTAPHPDARLIDLTWPGWRPVPAADGLITFVPDPRARTAWADQILAQHPGGFVLWSASGGQPHLILPQVSRRPGVRGIALAPAGSHPAHLQAALHLAHRLTNETAQPSRPGEVRVVSPVAPDTPEELVRVPHLVTLHSDTNAATDAALWELLSAQTARDRFGTGQAELRAIEASVPQLIALRTASRTGRIPDCLPPALAALLQQSPGPLTTETILPRLDLILDHRAAHRAGAP